MFIRSKCILGVVAKDGTCPIYPGCIADVDDAEGKRAVESGYAEEVSVLAVVESVQAAPDANPGENPSEGENVPEGPENAENKAWNFESQSFAELKAMAQELGIDTGKLKSKAKLIEAIEAATTYTAADSEEDFPDLTAQDVVEE